MAILNGTELKLYATSSSGVGTDLLVAFAQNCTLNVEHSPREITNKESAGFAENLEGLRSWSIDVDGAYAWTNAAGNASLTNGADDILETNVLNARQKFQVRFGGLQTGSTHDVSYYGDVYITSFSATGGTEDTATYSFSLTGTGELYQLISA
tara:strand:- start:1110 stop:1568 length:459 start_codon:yes stop_codon:yes gene_type:complete